MRWAEVRTTHPNQWLLIEALEARTESHQRLIDQMTVVEVCPDGATALRRYRELHRDTPGRELYYVHTGNAELTIDERPWTGIRRNVTPQAAR